jgi:hypothetical protein
VRRATLRTLPRSVVKSHGRADHLLSPYMKGLLSNPNGGNKMSVLATGAFWAATLERAVKTFCQSVLAVIGVAGVTPVDVDWKEVLLMGAFGALASILTSVVSAPVGNAGPSFGGPEVLTPPAPPVPAAEV